MEAVTLTVPLVALPILNNKMTIENLPTPSILASPAEKERYKVHGAEPDLSSPAAFRELPRRETVKWAQLMKLSGTKLD
jgi:hypothetical protein